MLSTTWRKVMHTKSVSFDEINFWPWGGWKKEDAYNSKDTPSSETRQEYCAVWLLQGILSSGGIMNNKGYVKRQHKIGSELSLSVNLTMVRNMLVKNYLQKIKLIVIDWYLTENLWGGLKTRVHARRPWMLTYFSLHINKIIFVKNQKSQSQNYNSLLQKKKSHF